MELKLKVLGGGCKLTGARRGTLYMVNPSQLVFWDDDTKDVYVVKGVSDMAWYGPAGVALRKVYALLTGIPLTKISSEVNKRRKKLEQEGREASIRDLRERAEALGFDITAQK